MIGSPAPGVAAAPVAAGVTAAAAPILEIDDLVKDYPGGRRALDGINLRVAAGELVVVLGANGSSKSTLLRCAVRLVDPSAGSVRFGGLDLARLHGAQLRDARRGVAMIFQSANLVKRVPRWPTSRPARWVGTTI